MDAFGNLGGSQQIEKCCVDEPSSILVQLRRRQVDTQKRLDDITAAVRALEENPQIASVLELVARVR